jgi:hypothetical protein
MIGPRRGTFAARSVTKAKGKRHTFGILSIGFSIMHLSRHMSIRRNLRRLTILAAMPVALGRPMTLDAQVAASDSAMLVLVTQQLLDAITNGDSAVWARHLSSRWTITDEEGHRIKRAEFLRDLHPLPPGQSGVLRLADWHIAGTPTAMVVSYATDEEHHYYGQTLTTRFRSTDTWVREGKVWRMLGSQITALPTPIQGRALPRHVLDEYAGTYVLTPGITVKLSASDSGLQLIRGLRQPERLYAIDARIFIRHGVRGFWLFERDSAGAISRLVNWRDNNPVAWRRQK